MSFEVDLHAVGDGESSGDAITLRYGPLGTGEQRVVVVDGGYRADGERLVDFIPRVYGTRTVDLVVSTHPHEDHVSGLRPIVESLDVRELWIHRPWARSASIATYVRDGRVTHRSLTERLQRAFSQAHELEALALRNGVPTIREPFAGTTYDGRVTVAGPTEQYYTELMGAFDEEQRATSLRDAITRAARAAAGWITETWDCEALAEPADDAVSPVNNSSAILYVQFDELILLTADAGVPALTRALDLLSLAGLSTDFRWLQPPHHGSKRNVGPAVLNRLLGSPFGAPTGKWALVSAARDGAPKHPSQRVINAVLRRGATAQVTAGQNICFHSADIGNRPGFSPLTSLDFVTAYED